MDIVLTDEQKEIINFEPNKNDNLLVSAYAGAAKTFTLFQYAQKRPNSKILYLAFNKTMALEAQEKFKELPNVDAKTIHSLAFSVYGPQYQKRLGNLRAYDLIKNNIVSSYSLASEVINTFFAYINSNYKSIEEFIEDSFSSNNLQNKNDLIKYSIELWNTIVNPDGDMTVPHDVYLKLFHVNDIQIFYDYILIDEAQDVTDCVIDIALKQKAKKIFVGDSFQQIYSWKYAVDSIEKLKNTSDMLYLTQSFRCPQYVADYANSYLEILQATKPFRGTETNNDSNNSMAAIARCNGTLFDLAAELNLDEIDIHFLGGVNSYNFETIIDIKKLIENKKHAINDAFIKQFKSITELKKYINSAKEIDLQTRLNIAEKHKNIENIYRKIKACSKDKASDADLVLTTAHKVKGKEFDKIHVLDDFHKIYNEAINANSDNPTTFKKEELNLLYVTLTRTKNKIECPNDYILSPHQIKLVQQKINENALILT